MSTFLWESSREEAMGKIMQGDYVGMSWGRLFEEACEILYASMFLCDPLHNFDNIIPFCVLDPGLCAFFLFQFFPFAANLTQIL